MTDAWTVDPRLLPDPASRSRRIFTPPPGDCASPGRVAPPVSTCQRRLPVQAKRRRQGPRSGRPVEVPLRAAAVPPPTPSLQLGHRDPRLTSWVAQW